MKKIRSEAARACGRYGRMDPALPRKSGRNEPGSPQQASRAGEWCGVNGKGQGLREGKAGRKALYRGRSA